MIVKIMIFFPSCNTKGLEGKKKNALKRTTAIEREQDEQGHKIRLEKKRIQSLMRMKKIRHVFGCLLGLVHLILYCCDCTYFYDDDDNHNHQHSRSRNILWYAFVFFLKETNFYMERILIKITCTSILIKD